MRHANLLRRPVFPARLETGSHGIGRRPPRARDGPRGCCCRRRRVRFSAF
jgi:hypothetical protein